MSTIRTILLAAVVIGVASCKKDKENPTIEVISPANHSNHHWGDQITISALFSDDRELASYHIHVGDADGNHTHDFHFEKEGVLSVQEHRYDEDVMIPDSVGMEYYIHFEVTDAEGKVTTDKVMIHIAE